MKFEARLVFSDSAKPSKILLVLFKMPEKKINLVLLMRRGFFGLCLVHLFLSVFSARNVNSGWQRIELFKLPLYC